MRDPNRIEPFLHDLGVIWKYCAPDWRFGQVIENVFGDMRYIPFMLEEDRMLEEMEKYFNVEKDPNLKRKLKYKKENKQRKNVRNN